MFYELKHLGSSEYFHKEEGTNFEFPTHLHSCFELIVILSGSMEVTVGTSVYTIEENEAVLIFPNQIHSLNSSRSEHILYIFSPELVKSFSSKVAGKIPLNNKFKPDDYLMPLLQNMTEGSAVLRKKGMLYTVCAAFDESAEYTERRNDKKNLLLEIFEFVESEYERECSLKVLSEKLNYDYSYLSRYVKGNIGISFNDYVNRYRISKACELIVKNDLTILQCALKCGYNSLRSFNRNFKLILDVSPSQFKKKALESK